MIIKIPSNKAISLFPAGANAVFIPGGSALEVFKPGIKWLLRDEFTTDLAAGSVHGTNAVPGPGLRTVVDVDAMLYLSGGVCKRNYTTAVNSSNLYLNSITQVTGRLAVFEMTWLGADSRYNGVGLDSNNTGTIISGSYIRPVTAGGLVFGCQGVTSLSVVPITQGASGKIVFAIGAVNGLYRNLFVFYKETTNYSLLYRGLIASTNVYPGIELYFNINYQATSSFIRIPPDLWVPTPLLSDGFGSTFGTSDGLGHAEGVAGGLGAGGGGLTWTTRLGTWANAAGVASCTELDVGASLGIATATLNTADVLYSCVLGYSAGSGGVIIRYKDAANYVYAIHDGTNVKLFEVTDASPYPGTQRGTGIKAPAAGARLIVDVSGAAARVYYNEALIFTYDSVADTTAKTIGLITNNVGNTFNDAVAWAKGTGGEYSILDRYSRN